MGEGWDKDVNTLHLVLLVRIRNGAAGRGLECELVMVVLGVRNGSRGKKPCS